MHLKDLDFYIVPNSYITYLQKAESIKRGFTRVPNMDYGKNHKPKFICGIVLKINDVSYFVPVSSYICIKNYTTFFNIFRPF